jgi:hypothetical protein
MKENNTNSLSFTKSDAIEGFSLLSLEKLEMDLGEPTHILVPCWMSKPLPPRNQCMGWFAPALEMPP